MDWRKIPSLFSLRAFEATARLGNLTRAGAELNVTHAAVSQHLRKLEEELGLVLLDRSGRKMQLTEAGQRLAASLSDGFGRIAQGIDDLKADQAGKPLSLTTTPSFAENWLMPRLGSFWSAHPDVKLSISPGTRVADLRQSGHDLAIRYGRGDWPGYEVRKLASARFYVVASPAFRDREVAKGQTDFTTLPWFFDPTSVEHRRWAVEKGHFNPDLPSSLLETLHLVMAAVRSGYGVTVTSQALIERDLDTGALVSLAEGDAAPYGYYIVRPKGPPPENVTKFLTWLRKAAA